MLPICVAETEARTAEGSGLEVLGPCGREMATDKKVQGCLVFVTPRPSLSLPRSS